MYGSLASIASASARIDARKSSRFSRAARWTFSKASRIDTLIRLKLADRAAISAVPPTSTVAPYSPSLIARVESASRAIGCERRRAKTIPRRSAPASATALQSTRVADHQIDRGEGEVEVALEEHAPVRLADGRDRGEHGAASRLLGPGHAGREAREVRDERRGVAAHLRARREGEEDRRPSGRRASPAPRGGPRRGTPAGSAPRRRAPRRRPAGRRPRRAPGAASTATGPERRHPERLARSSAPRAGRPRSPGGTPRPPRGAPISGPANEPEPSRLKPRRATSDFCRWRAVSSIRGPSCGGERVLPSAGRPGACPRPRSRAALAAEA